jgi:hypothetical protein
MICECGHSLRQHDESDLVLDVWPCRACACSDYAGIIML